MTYSRQDFTGQTLVEEVIEPQEIIGSCFSQEVSNSHIFPEDMTGVTFINCNLDNCYIPPGNTVEGGLNRQYKAMEDGLDWEIDDQGNPIKILGT